MSVAVDQKRLVEEHLKLQNEFRAYVRQHGFNYGEYAAPPPGSFYESYRKRWTELTRKITTPLHAPSE